MAAKKRSQAGEVSKRKAGGRKMLAHWFDASTIREIKTLAKEWGMGFERDVIAEAIRRAAASP